MADRKLKLTRNQRRQIDKLEPHVRSILDDDIAFFKKHPDRRYRIRRANDAEIAQVEILEDEPWQPPQGCCWFAIVKNVPGANQRMFVPNDPRAETGLDGLDAPDDLAEAIWEEFPDFLRIVDVVTVVTHPAMVTGRLTKVTFEPLAEADPSHAFPRRLH